jgi:uncharacterized BrkB/YihY/UPF0761 family membrane protein
MRPVVGRVRDIGRLTALSFWRGFLGFYNSDNLTYAASIAYYSLLSLFPCFLLGLAVLGRVTAADADRAKVLEFVLRYFPRQFDFITKQLEGFSTNTVTLSVAGALALTWGALGVFGAVTTAVNYAWGVEAQRSFWKHKLLSFVMLLVAGAMLIIALLLVSASSVVGASWFAGVLARFPGLMVLRSLTVRYATTGSSFSSWAASSTSSPTRKCDSATSGSRARHRSAVEGRARRLFLVHARHVPVHARERVDRRGGGLSRVGVPAER